MAGEAPRGASLAEVARTVLAALLGVRRRAAHDRDAVHLSPAQVVIVAVVLVALFVFTLVAIVRIVAG